MNDLVADIIGWIGAGALLFAYGMISAGRFRAEDRKYQGLNVFGSLGLIVNSTWYGAYPSTALNILWIAIGIFTFRRILKERKKGSGSRGPSPSSQ